jgi:hypothetical protein
MFSPPLDGLRVSPAQDLGASRDAQHDPRSHRATSAGFLLTRPSECVHSVVVGLRIAHCRPSWANFPPAFGTENRTSIGSRALAHPREAHHEPTPQLAPNTAVPSSAARRCVGARMAGGHGSRALQPGWGWRRPCDRLAGRGSRRRQRRAIHRCDRWRSVDQVPIVKRVASVASPFLPRGIEGEYRSFNQMRADCHDASDQETRKSPLFPGEQRDRKDDNHNSHQPI